MESGGAVGKIGSFVRAAIGALTGAADGVGTQPVSKPKASRGSPPHSPGTRQRRRRKRARRAGRW